MRAGTDSCSCTECGAVCNGRFEGCAGVWASDAQPVMMLEAAAAMSGRASASASANGHADADANGLVGRKRLGPLTPDAPSAGGQIDLEPPSRSDVIAGRADVIRWFETAFEGLREEMRAAVTEQRERTVETIEEISKRQAERQPHLPTAESLLQAAGDAARKAVTEALEGVERSITERIAAVGQAHGRAVEDLRFELQNARVAHGRAIADVQRSVSEFSVEVAASEETRRRGISQLKSMNRTLTEQLKPISDIVIEVRADLTSVVDWLDSLAEALAESATGADLAAVLDRLDGLAETLNETGEKPPAMNALPSSGGGVAVDLSRPSNPGLTDAWNERISSRRVLPPGDGEQKQHGRRVSLRSEAAEGRLANLG